MGSKKEKDLTIKYILQKLFLNNNYKKYANITNISHK